MNVPILDLINGHLGFNVVKVGMFLKWENICRHLSHDVVIGFVQIENISIELAQGKSWKKDAFLESRNISLTEVLIRDNPKMNVKRRFCCTLRIEKKGVRNSYP